MDLLLGWRKANVTGLTDPVAVVDALIGDSLALLGVPALRELADGQWIDLGAGAGIPGIPLAVALPGARVTLLDAVAKKCAFLEEAVRVTGLEDRAGVVCARSESYGVRRRAGARGAQRWCSRAPSRSSPCWSSWRRRCSRRAARCWRARRDGRWRWKAPQPRPRPRAAASSSRRRCRSRLRRSTPRVCVVYRKIAPAPDWLPRREGMAAKRPLGA